MSKTPHVAMSCPYCEKPALFESPKGKASEEVPIVVNQQGRFWATGGSPSVLRAHKYGPRWVAEVPSKNFHKLFDGFTARVVGVDTDVKDRPPPPFGNHLLSIRKRRPAVAPNPDFPFSALTIFSACVIEHVGGGVRVEAHWWPSHGWIINQRVTLTAEDAAERNAQLEHAYRALDFFLMETRGAAPRITEASLKEALAELRMMGAKPTQRATAGRLGVSETALEKWRRVRQINTWQEVVNHFADT